MIKKISNQLKGHLDLTQTSKEVMGNQLVLGYEGPDFGDIQEEQRKNALIFNCWRRQRKNAGVILVGMGKVKIKKDFEKTERHFTYMFEIKVVEMSR